MIRLTNGNNTIEIFDDLDIKKKEDFEGVCYNILKQHDITELSKKPNTVDNIFLYEISKLGYELRGF